MADGSTEAALYRRLGRLMWPCRASLAGVLLVGLLAGPLTLMTPLPLKLAVDSVLGAQPLPGPLQALLPATVARSKVGLLLLAGALLVALALLARLQELTASLLRAWAGERLVLAFRAQLFRHAQRLSLAYHDAQGTSDATYRIQYDAQAIQFIAVDGIIPLVTSSVTLAAMFVVTARIDWELALVALAISPPLFLLSRTYRRRMRRYSKEVKQLESSTLKVVQEALSALRVVKAFGQEERESERFVRGSSQGMRARLRLALAEGAFGLLVGLTTALGMAVALTVGIHHVDAGVLTLGELLLVLGYLSQLYEPLKTLSRKTATLQSHLVSAGRAFALLDEAPDVPERPNPRPLVRASGAVSFRSVCFSYGGDRPVLHDISFDIGPGTRLGIAGTTGSGKSTLVNLLARFFDPTSGQILLDGVDLRDYRLVDLRSQFAIVSQEPVLFSTSIAENIAYSRPGASERDIVAAARAANAHDFISRLPRGYATPVGERGMQLSGGERQRISLARAFLKDAPVLIFDEPTSALDVHTEAAVMEAMGRLMRGRTTFLIAHRLSTLTHCDRVVYVEQGRLAEAGPGRPSSPELRPSLP